MTKILVISDEATGKIKTDEVNPTLTRTIVPVKKLDNKKSIERFMRGKFFDGIRINCNLGADRFLNLSNAIGPNITAMIDIIKKKG